MLEGIPGIRIKSPELKAIRGWLNSNPLTIATMKGKVVLVDFWTYTCVNCLRTIPYLKRWHEKYADKGLVIIGVHTPEFGFEGEFENVEGAVKRLGIKYPVALDSDMRTWRAFDNDNWPAEYLIDKEGYVAYLHFGEGGYTETERAIQEQLGISVPEEKEAPAGYMFDQSPETYAGFRKNDGLGSGLACDRKGCRYVDPGGHDPDTIYPDGDWEQEKDHLELKKAPGKLSYRFNAREVSVVMAPVDGPVKADVSVDGKVIGSVTVDRPDTYTVFKATDYGERELVLSFQGKVRVFVYTFG